MVSTDGFSGGSTNYSKVSKILIFLKPDQMEIRAGSPAGTGFSSISGCFLTQITNKGRGYSYSCEQDPDN